MKRALLFLVAAIVAVGIYAGEMPSHVHDTALAADCCTIYGLNIFSKPAVFGSSYGFLTTALTSSTGGGLPHNNIQPSFVLNYIIKY
jgi:microcystin-dependent protein